MKKLTHFWQNPIGWVVTVFVVWRFVLFVVPVVAEQLPFRPDFEFTSPNYSLETAQKSLPGWLSAWANFDGVHYLAIAGRGYQSEVRFFPLFPLLIKAVTLPFNPELFSTAQILAGLMVSNITFIASLWVFYRLLRLDFDEKTTRRSVIALLFFPTAFFFVSIYSESLFLLLTLLSFYWARKGEWGKAALAGMLLTTTRLVGIFILPALIWEFWQQHKQHFSKDLLKKGWALVIVPLGLVAFIVFNQWQWGNSWYFITAQGELSNSRTVNSLVTPVQTLVRYGKILTTLSPVVYEWWVAGLEVVAFFFVAGLLFYAWKKKVRSSYLLFSVLAVALPAFSGNFTGLPRYILVAFPMFIVLGMVRRKWLSAIYVFVSVLLSMLLLTAFARGYFVA